MITPLSQTTKQRILILCGSNAEGIAATNVYTAMLQDHDIRIVEETTLTFQRIWAFCRHRLKNKQFFSLVGSLLYYGMLLLFQRSPQKNYTPSHRVKNLNTSDILPTLLVEFAPHYVLTSCCGVLKAETLSLLPQETYNIHPGINPLYRGFGNLWALARNDMEHLGYTIHKIDESIDTGERMAVAPLTPHELAPVSCIHIDSFVYRLAAQHLSRILLGTDTATVPDRYQSLASQYVGVPTLGVFLKARKNLKHAAQSAPQHILITGASSGLGAALARQYARPGNVLTLWGRDKKRLEAVAQSCQQQGAATYCVCQDIQNFAQTSETLQALYDKRPFDLAILGAGVSSGTMPDASIEPVELACQTLTTNATATINCAGTLLKLMDCRGAGRIACLSSIASFYPLPDSPAYSASKVALAYYIKAMRPLVPFVRLSLIYPGYVDTPMSRRLAGPQPFRWSAEQAAGYIQNKLSNGALTVIFPKILALGIWILNFLPPPVAYFFVQRFGFTIEPGKAAPPEGKSEI